jgi:hypothetical protein
MAFSSSSLWQFGLLLSFMASIGTLLMIVPNVHALECYYTLTPNASATFVGARAAREVNKIFHFENGQQENPLMVSIGGGEPTAQCPTDSRTYCATIQCAGLYGIVGTLNVN